MNIFDNAGRIVKHDSSNTVELPWGSEYKIRFRNKHNRRACVKLWIDGEQQHKAG